MLLLDAGNTRIKWAVDGGASLAALAAGDWQAGGAVGHARIDQLAAQWRALGASLGEPRALLANVAGMEIEAQLLAQLAAAGISDVCVFRSTARCAGVHNAYRDPTQLGSDRFASVVGAQALFPGEPLLVVTCGTATTVNALQADGRFIGGMILPGVALMAASLATHTAELPAVDVVDVPLFADNTHDAIASGCLNAQLGAIRRALAAHPARCVLSGGAAALLAPHIAHCAKEAVEVVDNLVLVGLAASARAGA